MKLIKALTISAVIGTALCLSPSSQAFWGGEGDPTYENLHKSNYLFRHETQKKAYDSPGWIVLHFNQIEGDLFKIKLVDCRGNKCTYFTKRVDNPNKWVEVSEINCMVNKFRDRQIHDGKAQWTEWRDFSYLVKFKVKNKFCS